MGREAIAMTDENEQKRRQLADFARGPGGRR
jgi:hypothetical protein